MKQTTRYPWHLAPEWAKSAATHLGGTAFWYGDPIAEEPSEKYPNGCWFFKTEQIEGSFDSSDWQNSLEFRPQIITEFDRQRVCIATQRALLRNKIDQTIKQLSTAEPTSNTLIEDQISAQNVRAIKRLLEAPSHREQLRAEFAGRALAAALTKIEIGRTFSMDRMCEDAVQWADVLISKLYPPPQNTTEHGK